MKITIDTSALIAVIGNEASKQAIINITEGASLYAPMSVHWEIGNAFSAMFKRRRITIEQAKQALVSYKQIQLKYIDVPLKQSLEISKTLNIYAYDAYLIQCALQTSTGLLTLDRGLKLAAEQMSIELLEPRK